MGNRPHAPCAPRPLFEPLAAAGAGARTLRRCRLTQIGIVGCILIATVVYVAMALCICLMVPYQVSPPPPRPPPGAPTQQAQPRHSPVNRRRAAGPAAALHRALAAALPPPYCSKHAPSFTPSHPKLIDKGASFATAMVQGEPLPRHAAARFAASRRPERPAAALPHHTPCPDGHTPLQPRHPRISPTHPPCFQPVSPGPATLWRLG
jgi:hypothetical protein